MGILVLIISLLLSNAVFANSVSQKLMEQGIKSLASKNYKSAKRFCEQAMVADPKDGRGYACVGRSWAKAGNGKYAEHYYELALALTPNYKNALMWSAERDLAIGRPDKARTKLNLLEKTCNKCEMAKELRTTYLKYKAKKSNAKNARK